jgi:hypothetical protein
MSILHLVIIFQRLMERLFFPGRNNKLLMGLFFLVENRNDVLKKIMFVHTTQMLDADKHKVI